MILGSIVFAFKVILAALLVVPLFMSRHSPVSRESIGTYALISVVSAALTILSVRMHSGWIAGALVIAIGIVSYTQFQKEKKWQKALQLVAPFWLVAAIGMTVGAGRILSAVILTAVSYTIINYFPTLLFEDKGAGEKE